MMTLPKHLKKIDKKITENGYSLNDIASIMQDKDSVLILFVFLFKAIFYAYLTDLESGDKILTEKFFKKTFRRDNTSGADYSLNFIRSEREDVFSFSHALR